MYICAESVFLKNPVRKTEYPLLNCPLNRVDQPHIDSKMCIHTHAHARFLTILFHFFSPRLFSTFPVSSLALCLKPAWRAGVGGGVLTWHWVCWARSPVAAGGPFGFRWGQGLLIAECAPTANMLIWNTNPELTSEEGEAGVRGRFATASSAIHSSLPSGFSFLFSFLPGFPPCWCLGAYINTHRLRVKTLGKGPKN